MATNGKKWLRLNKTPNLKISFHALDRLQEYTGRFFTEEEAQYLFETAEHLPVEEVRGLGYRPAYDRRLNREERSWYFRMRLGGRELIAVVGQKDLGDPAWVTTYTRNRQTDLLAFAC